MTRRYLSSVIGLSTVFFSAGCSPQRPAVDACAVVPESASGHVATGYSDGTGEDGRRSAFINAVKRGIAPIVGVYIRSEFTRTFVDDDTNGARNVREVVAKDDRESFVVQSLRDFKTSYCTTPDGRTRADVVVPGSEVERLKRRARGATKVFVACSSDVPGACEPALSDRVRVILRAASLNVSDVADAPASATAAELARDARASGSAGVVLVKLAARLGKADDTYISCRAQPSATLFDSDDAKGMAEAKPVGPGSDGGFKGTVFRDGGTPREACAKAFKEALKALESAVTDDDSDWAKVGKVPI